MTDQRLPRHSTPAPAHPLLRSGLVFALMLAPFAAAHAYVGPGAGLSLLGALWGVIAAIGAALLFVVMWPIRRLMRRNKTSAAEADRADDSAADRDEPGSK